MPDYHGFDVNRTIPNKRTMFDSLSHKRQMTLSEGEFRANCFFEVLPSDIINLEELFSVQNIPSAYRCVIDEAYMDINWFFVPRRLLWKHWESFIGADATPDAYTDPVSYEEPTITITGSSAGAIERGSLLNSLRVPYVPAGASITISPFPIAGIALIWNTFYRDENIQDENPFPTICYELESGAQLEVTDGVLDDHTESGLDVSWMTSGVASIFNSVNRYHDQYSSCLPKPQKGNPILLPLGSSAPVKGWAPIFFENKGSSIAIDEGDLTAIGVRQGVGTLGNNARTRNLALYYGSTFKGSTTTTDPGTEAELTAQFGSGQYASVDLSAATAASINDLRLAFAGQAYLEALARSGSRYTELLKSMFGCNPTDARLQRPEFLGTLHCRIGPKTVASTAGSKLASEGSSTDRPTGSLASYMLTDGKQGCFVKQIEEFGYIYGIVSIRVAHTYGQGIPKVFLKKDRFDYYNKYFDRIGNVPVGKNELYYSGTGTFGFQEAWYEYKFHENEVTGAIGPGGATDLAAYTYADDFDGAPTLNSDFMIEDRGNIDNTLVGASGVPQFVCDFYHDIKATRPMSANSVPVGLGY